MLTPDPAALRHLDTELAWMRSILELRLRELQRQGVLPLPEQPWAGVAIGPEEVEARLRRHRETHAGPGGLPADDDARAALGRAHGAREELRSREDPASPWPLLEVQRACRLSDDEYFLLLLTLAPEFDPSFPRLYAYLQDHFERQYPTLGLVADCLLTESSPSGLRHLLDESAPLRALRLIHLDDSHPATPLMYCPLVATQRVVRFVEGPRSLDPGLQTCCLLWPALTPSFPEPGEVDTLAWDQLRAVGVSADARGSSPPLLVLQGPVGVGRRHHLRALARASGRALLVADLPRVALAHSTLAEGLRLVAREVRLHRALLCLDGWEELLSPRPGGAGASEAAGAASNDGDWGAACLALERALAQIGGTVALTVGPHAKRLPRLPQGLSTVTFAPPDATRAAHIWKGCLPEHARASDVDAAWLTAEHELTPGEIRAAADEARLRAARASGTTHGLVGATLLAEVLRDQVQTRLGEVAERVESRYRWEDLILPATTRVQLLELVHRHRHRAQVLATWGLGRRFGERLGISVLLEGPSGTGKTMAASIVAGELGQQLFQVDLSRVVSRWLGETEKSLARIFDQDERARVVLLFDEADSLFAKRTRVESANDRYANLEVNYLLQRLERFTGITILTTNFPESIDEAFRRRLTTRIAFPLPAPEQRAALWSSMLAEGKIPRKRGIDCHALAEEFEMSGGLIRNAVLRACFIAAAHGKRLDQALLRLAASIELIKQGTLVRGNPHAELAKAWALDR